MKMKFNQSQLKIIDLLVRVKYFMTISDMSEKVAISERSVYKNLSQINQKLKAVNIEGTRNVYGQGYYLSEDSKRQIQQCQAGLNHNQYSAKERQYLEFIGLYLKGQFSVQKVCERCEVSKQTVLKDIENLKHRMRSYDITIISNYDGHFLSGSEVKIRQFLFAWLYAHHDLAKLYDTSEITELRSLISQWLNSFESANNIIYSEEFINPFEYFYALTLQRIFNEKRAKDNAIYPLAKKIKSGPEYQFARSFLTLLLGDHFDEFEQDYLTSVLLGGQKRKLPKDGINDEIGQIVWAIIKAFKNLADCSFKDENKLHQDLVVHLATTFFRVKYRQQYQNSDFDLIKENYPDIYIYTKMSIHPFERFIGASLNDYEVGLVSVYFASQIARKQEQAPEVLLVSSGSNGSAGFLMTQMVEQYPYVNFSMPLAPSELKNNVLPEKVVITNIALSGVAVPWLKVNTVLTGKDFENIDHFFQLNGITNAESLQTEYKALMETIYDNTQVLNEEELKKGIRQVLIGKRKHEEKTKRTGPLLSEVLTEDQISFSHNQKITWEDAIRLCAQPLLAKGNIERRYIDAMINNVKENGPYINIGTEIALAHARPNQGVNKLGMALLLLDHDIDLVDADHQIRLIIVLAASDATSHLRALSELAKILGNKKEVAQIMNAKTAREIEELIEKGEK